MILRVLCNAGKALKNKGRYPRTERRSVKQEVHWRSSGLATNCTKCSSFGFFGVLYGIVDGHSYRRPACLFFKIWHLNTLKVVIIDSSRCTNFSQSCFGMKLYLFRRFPLSIIRIFPLYTQQCYMSYRFADSLRAGADVPARKLSANLYDIYHCCVYSWKILMMDRGNLRNT